MRPPHQLAPAAATDKPASSFQLPAVFGAKDADVILKSWDGIQFWVYRRFLIEASPFFRAMFELPQPESEEAVPTVDMQEAAPVLSALLQCIYPVPQPLLSCLEEIIPVIRAGLKYEMDAAISTLRRMLIEPRFLDHDALGVYAVACQMGFNEEAQLASSRTLRVEMMTLLLPHPTKLGGMLAVDLVQLVALRVTRCARAKAILKRESGLGHLRCACGTMPAWFTEWRKRAVVELDKHPVSDVIFSAGFLGEIMSVHLPTTCATCCHSSFDRQFWDALKAEIDALPDTI